MKDSCPTTRNLAETVFDPHSLLGVRRGTIRSPVARIGPAADTESCSRFSILLSLSCRPRPLCHTTVQTVMASLAGEQVLARSRRGRTDFCRAVTHTRLRK